MLKGKKLCKYLPLIYWVIIPMKIGFLDLNESFTTERRIQRWLKIIMSALELLFSMYAADFYGSQDAGY